MTTTTTTKRPKAATTKQPTSSKFKLSKRQLRQLQALAKVSEIVVTASEDESEREAILKEFFLNNPKIGSSFKRLIESQREALVKHPTEFSRSLKIRTGSKKELEAFWREENKRKHNTELHTLPRTFGERPVALRGRDFVDGFYALRP
jgi:hypothetical protein